MRNIKFALSQAFASGSRIPYAQLAADARPRVIVREMSKYF